jgi:fructoselysine-6-P-deglycase FrlB-like protein
MVGHGSSDNAASYGVYAFGLLPRWTALRDSITLTVYYRTPLDMSGSTVIALSQSGRTPDVIEFAEGVRSTAGLLEAMIPALEPQVRRLALPFASVERMFVIGRGTEFATAREIALKLLETCRIAAAASRVRAAGATLVASGPAAEALADAAYVLPVPRPPSPLLSLLLSVVPGQLFAWALAQAKGLDPDSPVGLSKVTLAR